MSAKPRLWRRAGIALWTGDKFRGACFWPWRGELVRLQCWTYPRNRIVTFRKSRTVDEAKRLADRWLSRHAAPPLTADHATRGANDE